MDGDRTVYHLNVGGKPFALDVGDVEKLGSPFLTTLVDPESRFAPPDDGIFMVGADAACFSAFLSFSRFGAMPQLALSDEMVLEQADFWGLHEKVGAEIDRVAKQRSRERSDVYRLMTLTKELEDSKRHHNFRRDYRCGRIYCTDYGNRDMDSRWYDSHCDKCRESGKGRKYIDCKGCKTTVFYRKNLEWCHKCSLCLNCQNYDECPNDDNMTCSYYYEEKKTTEQIKKEVNKLNQELGL